MISIDRFPNDFLVNGLQNPLRCFFFNIYFKVIYPYEERVLEENICRLNIKLYYITIFSFRIYYQY